MFRPIYDALGREFRPGTPLSTEIRRRIVDLYLNGEGPRQSHEQFVLLKAECVIIKRTCTFIKEDEEILLTLRQRYKIHRIVQIDEMTSMFGREIRERLLNDGETYQLYRWKQGNKEQSLHVIQIDTR